MTKEKCFDCQENVAELCQACAGSHPYIRCGDRLCEAWRSGTQGMNQCVRCGKRELSPAEENKIPKGWTPVKKGDFFDMEMVARWNIWLGICPACHPIEEGGEANA